MAGAVVLPVTGFIVGGTQIVRGVINTPEAVRQSFLGKHWDQVFFLLNAKDFFSELLAMCGKLLDMVFRLGSACFALHFHSVRPPVEDVADRRKTQVGLMSCL